MAATHFIPPVNQHVSDETTVHETAAHEAAVGEAAVGDPPVDAAIETGNACQCGHIEGAHEHYRRGTDCALCPCGHYRKSDRFRRRLRSD